jgi:hypothetical protein
MKGIKGKLKGQLVQLEFLDHSIEKDPNNKAMRFIVWGEVMSITEELIKVRQWKLLNGSRETKKANDEVAKILVSTIVDIKFLAILKDADIEGH